MYFHVPWLPKLIHSQSESSARVVNTLLTELDGLESRKSVYVIAATNRPDMIDPAMVRPGRLDKLLYVDLPTGDERAEIVRTMVRKVPLGCTLEEVEAVARSRCDSFSGADLAALVREAGVTALRRTLGTLDAMEDQDVENSPKVFVGIDDFMNALEKVGPSVSPKQRRKYELLKSKLSGSPVGMIKEDSNVEPAGEVVA